MATLTEQVLALQRCEPEAIRNPYAIFNRVREEVGVLDYGPAVLVTRFEDVDTVFKTPEIFSAHHTGGTYFQDMHDRLPPDEQPMFRFMVDFESASIGRVDDPEHARIRKPIGRAMTADRIARLKERVLLRADALLDEVAAGDGIVDVMERFAYRLPLLVVGELLGIPLENYEQLHRWSEDWFAFKGNLSALRRAYETTQDFISYLEVLLRERRATPRDDLLSAMLQEGSDLTDRELMVNTLILITGGHETTTNLIGSTLWHLCSNPEQLAWVREDLNRVPNAIEEVLRFEPPVHSMGRLPVKDTELSGVPMPGGKNVLNMIAAANRDPRHFSDPDRFDATRSRDRFLTFGFGTHFCPGAPLARLESRIAITRILERFPRLELMADQPQWNPNYVLRGLKTLPMRFHTH